MNKKTIVVKVGSSSITTDEGTIDRSRVQTLCDEIADLHIKGNRLVVVTSGAIAAGLPPLNMSGLERPRDSETLQAVSAIGQGHLIQTYQEALSKHGLIAGQVLLTPLDFFLRAQYLHARSTLNRLLELGAIPVVNENDSTATSEIKYGDNDRLAARVAQIIGADMLILFSDVDGLYDKSKGKKIVRQVTSINEKIMSLMDNKKNKFGSGGIATKLDAAKICMNSGSHMFIANGKVNNPIANMIKNKKYTHFLPKISTLDARKKWIIGSLNHNGTIYIDNGAAKALSNGKSLLAAGITKINGNFKKGENVKILDQNNNQLARGLSSFSSVEIDKIKGKQSREIEKILGYLSKTEVIHKDDMVLL